MKMNKSDRAGWITLVIALGLMALVSCIMGCTTSITITGDIEAKSESNMNPKTQIGVTSSAQTSGSTNQVWQERSGGGVRDNAIAPQP